MHHRSGVTSSKIILGAILIAILAAIIPPIIARFTAETPRPIADLGRPAIHVEFDKVRPRLPYRMISFHRGRGDKRLIRLAHDLGFNGVQFQIEGSTVDGIKDFAKRDSQEHLVDFCHNLGMEVTVWVHEMSDLPPAWMPDWLGPVTTENQPLWKLLDDRYEWVLRDAIPNVDGLALTVVETQVRATNTQVMLKLAALLQDKCKKYNKSLMVRTFVWFPEEFENVMAAVNQLPSNMVIMSKCVPQDWNLRGMFASEIGKVGGRPQIIEYDVAGEYFRRNFVANCMPERLKAQFDAEMKTNISGICVRVDREDDNVLNQPNEMNLWTLGMLADGATDNLDEIWNAWARNRFGPAAADGVVRALKTTGDVVSEMLSVGPFSFGDNRKFPQIGDEDIFGQLHQNWWWDDSYAAVHMKGETGDPAFTAEVASAKEQARQLADQSLRDLDLIRDQLAPQDYSILKTRLLSNRVQLGFRAPMVMAVLHYRRMMNAPTPADRQAADIALQKDLTAVRQAGSTIYAAPKQITWLGQNWSVDAPDDYSRDAINAWAYQMDQLRQGIDPRPMTPRQRAFAKLRLDGAAADGVPPKSLGPTNGGGPPVGYEDHK